MAALKPRRTMTGPLLRGSGELHIVGRREVLTIADPDGAAQLLLALADGSRTRTELLDALVGAFPALDDAGADALVGELELVGLLDDAAPRGGRILSSRVVRRDAHERSLFAGPARAS